MATELLPWHWIVETLAQVEELDASILETIICRDPDFSKNAPEIVRERVALRYLEKLVPSSSASGVPSTSASFRANEPAVDVLKKVAGLCKLEKDKDKLHAPDLHQFILQKKASLPKSSLQLQLSSTLEGHSQLLSSLKEPSGLCIHSRADCLRCSIDDDNQRAKKLRLSRKDAEIQSPKQRSPVTAHDGGTVTLQEDYPGSAQHVNKRNVSDGERINFSSGEIEPLIQTLAASAPDGGKFNLKQDSSRPGKGGEIQPLRQTSAAPPSDRNDVNLQKDSSGLGQHLPKQNMPDVGSSHLHQDIGSTGGDTIQLLKDYSSLQNASSDRSTKNVNPASGKTDLFSGVPSVMPEASSDSDGACDVPSDFNLCDVFDNEKHRLLTSQSLANHDSVTGDWTEQGLCIKCDNGGQLLSCSASGCSIGVHESCLGPFVEVEKTGLFYCPFCSFRRAAIAYCKAREKLSSAKKALSAFLGKDPIPGHRKEQSSPKVHRETSQADVAGNLSHQSAVPHADKLNVSFSTAQEEHQQIEVAKVCDKAKLCSKQMDNPSGVEGCDVSHNPVENKHDKMFKKVSFPDSEDADTIINVENELGNNSEHVWVAEHQQPTEPQEGIDNGNLPCEDRDTSTVVHAHDVSKAKQNSNIDSADDHLHTRHLKNQGQVEAFLDHDTGHKSPSPQTSEKHRESRRQHAAVGEACHTQGTVGDQSRNKASPGKNLKYRSRPKRYSNPIIPSGRRKKLAWTVQEEEALKDAVQKFSVNSDGTLPWTKILEFGRRVFHKTRQPGDLKDKWRNIQIKEGLRTRKT